MRTTQLHDGLKKWERSKFGYEEWREFWRGVRFTPFFKLKLSDLSCDSRTLLSQLLMFGVKCCRLTVWYSGSGRKRRSISLRIQILRVTMSFYHMERSSRTYSIYHLLMRYNTIFLDYRSVARTVAKVCKNDGFPEKSQTKMLELYRTLTSFRSSLQSKCCLLQIPQRNAVLIYETSRW